MSGLALLRAGFPALAAAAGAWSAAAGPSAAELVYQERLDDELAAID